MFKFLGSKFRTSVDENAPVNAEALHTAIYNDKVEATPFEQPPSSNDKTLFLTEVSIKFVVIKIVVSVDSV